MPTLIANLALEITPIRVNRVAAGFVATPSRHQSSVADYRANAEDVAQDIADAKVKIACPVMSLWGADFYAVGKMFDMPNVWREMASNLVTHAIPHCGHLPQEEQPEVVTRLLVDFLEDWKADAPHILVSSARGAY